MSKPIGNIVKLLAGVLFVAPLSFAVAQHEERHGGHRSGMRHMGQLRMLRELDLSDDQRQQVRALFDEARATGVHERLVESRKALHDAIEQGADEGTLRQLASELGDVEGDSAVEGSRIQARVRELLTAEQRQELEQLKQEAEARMEERRKRFEERKSRRGKSGPNPL
ncbi:MAG: Spy/CpxP family protein refolding chaperone [Vicinamibacteria bacterium]